MLCFQSVLYCIVLYNDVFTFLYVAVGNKLLLLLLRCHTCMHILKLPIHVSFIMIMLDYHIYIVITSQNFGNN